MGGNRGTRTGQGGGHPGLTCAPSCPFSPPCPALPRFPFLPCEGMGWLRVSPALGVGGRPQMGPPPDPLPALPAALFGTRSAGGSTVTGHVPSSWCCHGPPVSPPRCHQHLPGEPGGPVALVAPGDHLDRGHPAKGNLPVPKMVQKDWFLPKNCIPAPPHTTPAPSSLYLGAPLSSPPRGAGLEAAPPGWSLGNRGGSASTQGTPRAPRDPNPHSPPLRGDLGVPSPPGHPGSLSAPGWR